MRLKSIDSKFNASVVHLGEIMKFIEDLMLFIASSIP